MAWAKHNDKNHCRLSLSRYEQSQQKENELREEKAYTFADLRPFRGTQCDHLSEGISPIKEGLFAVGRIPLEALRSTTVNASRLHSRIKAREVRRSGVRTVRRRGPRPLQRPTPAGVSCRVHTPTERAQEGLKVFRSLWPVSLFVQKAQWKNQTWNTVVKL